ncbi:Mucin-4 [Mactra antiquata]
MKPRKAHLTILFAIVYFVTLLHSTSCASTTTGPPTTTSDPPTTTGTTTEGTTTAVTTTEALSTTSEADTTTATTTSPTTTDAQTTQVPNDETTTPDSTTSMVETSTEATTTVETTSSATTTTTGATTSAETTASIPTSTTAVTDQETTTAAGTTTEATTVAETTSSATTTGATTVAETTSSATTTDATTTPPQLQKQVRLLRPPTQPQLQKLRRLLRQAMQPQLQKQLRLLRPPTPPQSQNQRLLLRPPTPQQSQKQRRLLRPPTPLQSQKQRRLLRPPLWWHPPQSQKQRRPLRSPTPPQLQNQRRLLRPPTPPQSQNQRLLLRQPTPQQSQKQRRLLRPPTPLQSQKQRRLLRPPMPPQSQKQRRLLRPQTPPQSQKQRRLLRPPTPPQSLKQRRLLRPPTPQQLRKQRRLLRPPTPPPSQKQRRLQRPPTQPQSQKQRRLQRPPTPPQSQKQRLLLRPATPPQLPQQRRLLRPPTPPQSQKRRPLQRPPTPPQSQKHHRLLRPPTPPQSQKQRPLPPQLQQQRRLLRRQTPTQLRKQRRLLRPPTPPQSQKQRRLLRPQTPPQSQKQRRLLRPPTPPQSLKQRRLLRPPTPQQLRKQRRLLRPPTPPPSQKQRRLQRPPTQPQSQKQRRLQRPPTPPQSQKQRLLLRPATPPQLPQQRRLLRPPTPPQSQKRRPLQRPPTPPQSQKHHRLLRPPTPPQSQKQRPLPPQLQQQRRLLRRQTPTQLPQQRRLLRPPTPPQSQKQHLLQRPPRSPQSQKQRRLLRPPTPPQSQKQRPLPPRSQEQRRLLRPPTLPQSQQQRHLLRPLTPPQSLKQHHSTTVVETTTPALTTTGATTVVETTSATISTDATTRSGTTSIASTSTETTTVSESTSSETTTDSTTTAETTLSATTIESTTSSEPTSTTTTTDSTTTVEATSSAATSSATTSIETSSTTTTSSETTSTIVSTSTTIGQTTAEEATDGPTSTTTAQTSTIGSTTVAETSSVPTSPVSTTTDALTTTTVTQTTADLTTTSPSYTTSAQTTATQSTTTIPTTSFTPTATEDLTTSTTVAQTTSVTSTDTTTLEASTVPRTTTDVPQTTTIVEASTSTSTVSQTTTEVPQTTTTVEASTSTFTVSQTTTEVPQTTTTVEASTTTSTVSQTTTEVPQTTTTVEASTSMSTVSQTTTEVPQTTTTVEGSTTTSTVSQTTTEVPQTTTTVEASTTTSTVSQTTTEVPQTTTTVEGSTTTSTVSQSTTEVPSTTTTSLPTSSEATTVTQTTTEAPTTSTISQAQTTTTSGETTTSSAPSTTVTEATTTSTVESTSTTSTTFSTTPAPQLISGIFLPYGSGVDSGSMSGTDDGCDVKIDVDYNIPIRDQSFRKIYICANGLLCFQKKYESYTIPVNGETDNDLNNIVCLAPYFSDLDLSVNGDVWYTIRDLTSVNSLDTYTDVNSVIALVNETYGKDDYNPAFFMVATWVESPRYGGPANETVTFQVIFTSDGEQSYTFYSYEPNGMKFTSGQQFIGLLIDGKAEGLDDSPSGSYLARADENLILNLYKGAATFQLNNEDAVSASSTTNYRMKCRSWHKQEAKNKIFYQTQLNKMPQCPCSAISLFFDRQFGAPTSEAISSSFSVPVLPSGEYAPNGKTCTYSILTGSYIQSGNNAGSFSTYNVLTYPRENFASDAYYKDVCCQQSDLCNLYYDVRPTGSCYSAFPFSFAGAFGDPHITTLDGYTYTFNGHAEYVLLSIPTIGFQIQSRTERAITSDNTLSEATIFSGFAIQSAGVWFQVEININKTGINVFTGANSSYWADFTDEFYANGNNFSYVTDLISLRRDGQTVMASFSATGVSFNATIGVGLLKMNIGMKTTYRTLTEGLMGNFNTNPDDDLIPRGSTVSLSSTATERQIFEDFGQTWMTTSDESIFKYNSGETHADYSFPNYVPSFLDEVNQTVIDEATSFCGTGNNQCIFDYVFTGNTELAADTTATQTQADENDAQASNVVPALIVNSGLTTIDGVNYLYTTINELATFTVLGTDDGTLTYQFVNNTAGASLGTPQNDGTVDVSMLLSNTDPVIVSVAAEDNLGVKSPTVDVIVVLCTGCNNNGVCNHSLIRDDPNSTENFKYATCECTPYWTGIDCETNFNGCEVNPCSVGRTCTDNSPAVHESTGKAYTCSPCPDGYQDINDKCFDINECDDATLNDCTQGCINTDSSYYCQCSSGYRLDIDGYTCSDVNECEESTSNCDQICTNSEGGYTCDCYTGYTYNSNTNICIQDAVPPTGCETLDCSNADGCSLNSTGSPVCFCNTGYQLQPDNSCTNINECDGIGVCSQICQDTAGSYSCSCYSGYTLDVDGNTCTACEFPTYGSACSKTCQCGRGSSGCDPVSGCICKTGWTGINCDTDINECTDANICGDPNKVCSNTVGSYTCICRNGFVLSNGNCVDINESEDATLNTCQQICTNTVGGYSCSCNTGYLIDTANAEKCIDFDECTAGISGCEQLCKNFDGRFSCECNLGFSLNTDRKTCTKVTDPCAAFSDVNCSDICLVVDNSPVCSCSNGYVLGADGKSCIDINECNPDLDLNKCSDPDSCLNYDGGYQCSCNAGFKLENDLRTCTECDSVHYGINCANECNCGVGAIRCDSVTGCVCNNGWLGEKCDIDRDECQVSPSVCTGVSEQCTNTPGSYTCTCESGYRRNSNNICTDINECSSQTLNDCSQICTNTEGSYECSCNDGFVQNGTQCNDIDECSGQNDCSQLCTNTVGSYRCSCNTGFKLDVVDKKTCIPQTSCFPQTNPCGANTDCAIVSGTETCFCQAGFQFVSGSTTECEDIPECTLSQPCSQQCLDLPGSFVCFCDQPGYTLDTDQTTCIVCPEGSYGMDCVDTCTCGIHTESCDPVDGTCNCKSGWEGVFCTTDINECSDSSIHKCPDNSVCINTPGSFTCTCNTGYLKTSDGVCQVCDKSHWGTNCVNNCTCVTENTDVCDNVDGSCTCNNGWSGITCSDDVNECDVDPNICGDVLKTCVNTVGSYKCECNSGYTVNNENVCIDDNECLLGTSTCIYQCTNIPGSYECSCFPGYTGTENNCIPCAFGFWGVQCVNTCGCNATNSIECDPVSGCVCKSGFTGATCSEDINECTVNTKPCPHNATCTNTYGSYECNCDIGFTEDGNNLCQACSSDTFGNNCGSNCDCVNSNTINPGQSCDHVTGTCQCTTFWTGTRCQTDVDECVLGTSNCDAIANQGCHNTEGGFQCSCLVGYSSNTDGDCVLDTTPTTAVPVLTGQISIQIYLALNYSVPSSSDLNVIATFQYYASELRSTLLNFFITEMGAYIDDIVIGTLVEGSIKSNLTVVMSDSVEAAQNFATSLYNLQSGSSTLQIFNQDVTAQELSVDGNIIDFTTSSRKSVLCTAFLEARGDKCGSNSECVIVSGIPTCQPIKTSDNFGLVIGLGVGIPLFLIGALIVGVVIIYAIKSRRRRRYYTEDMDRGSFNNGFFPHMMPTKISTWGRRTDPIGIYGPNTWDDDSTSTTSEREKYRPATVLRSEEVFRGYDNNGPISNFSWDFLYNYIHPHERYEIQRPQHDQQPHPVFTFKNNLGRWKFSMDWTQCLKDDE